MSDLLDAQTETERRRRQKAAGVLPQDRMTDGEPVFERSDMLAPTQQALDFAKYGSFDGPSFVQRWGNILAAPLTREAQPGDRGVLFPGKVGDDGKVQAAVPGMIAEPVESWNRMVDAPIADIMRSQDRNAIEQLATDSFNVAGALPLAGVAIGKAVGAPKPRVADMGEMHTVPDAVYTRQPKQEDWLLGHALSARARLNQDYPIGAGHARGPESMASGVRVIGPDTPQPTFSNIGQDPVPGLRRMDGSAVYSNPDDVTTAGVLNLMDQASLPMDQASRMARAREMGFDTSKVYYHGTSQQFDEFDPAMTGANYGSHASDGSGPKFYFGDDRRLAQKHANSAAFFDRAKGREQGEPRVLEVLLKDAEAVRGPLTSGEYIVRDPRNIRSVNAAFDPAKANSANLLASNPDDVTTAGILNMMDQGQQSPKGITAYHGSPHDFDRFSLDKIGTGEGAQAFGHGLYFAENEGVARSYRDSLTAANKGAAVGRLQQILRQIDEAQASDPSPHRIALRQEVESELQKMEQTPDGRMYEVRINAEPDDFLDWDKPLSEQGERVRRALSGIEHKAPGQGMRIKDYAETIAAAPQRDATKHLLDDKKINVTGSDIMNMLGTYTGRGNPDSTKALREAGIPGIKYLDAGSRTAGDGSRNYVVFDDALVEIMRKYMNPQDPSTAAILDLMAVEADRNRKRTQ